VGPDLVRPRRATIIVEIAKVSRHVDRAHFDPLQAGILKQAGKRGRLANRKATAFVELQGGRIQHHCGVPEVAFETRADGGKQVSLGDRLSNDK
jgi:hypothetical protein